MLTYLGNVTSQKWNVGRKHTKQAKCCLATVVYESFTKSYYLLSVVYRKNHKLNFMIPIPNNANFSCKRFISKTERLTQT